MNGSRSAATSGGQDRVQHRDDRRGDDRAREAVDLRAGKESGGDEQRDRREQPGAQHVQRPELRALRVPARGGSGRRDRGRGHLVPAVVVAMGVSIVAPRGTRVNRVRVHPGERASPVAARMPDP